MTLKHFIMNAFICLINDLIRISVDADYESFLLIRVFLFEEGYIEEDGVDAITKA